MSIERRTEWIMFSGFLVTPLMNEHFKIAMMHFGHKNMAEAIRSLMREMIDRAKKEAPEKFEVRYV